MEIYQNIEIEQVHPRFSGEVKEFLHKHGLGYDEDIEYTIALKLNGNIAATGSFAGNVLKCIAVEEEYKGLGLSSKIISELITQQYMRGRSHLFLYTKPENKKMFSDLGFYEIETVEHKAVLMENREDGIGRYTRQLEPFRRHGCIGSIVMNCNPFTLGHKYLIEYASSKCDVLHIFILWEDKSVFPNEVRYRLVREGVGHLDNVVVHKATNYIISNATFPSYFIKGDGEAARVHAKMDLQIFGRYIAPALGINKRFAGEEPYCGTTAVYNDEMKKVLPGKNIEVEQIRRYEVGSLPVSASVVRECLRNDELGRVKIYVPDVTYHFVLSTEGQEIIKKIKSVKGRL